MREAVKISNLSKEYTIGRDQGYKSLRREIINRLKNPLNYNKEKFWALYDINISIFPGESIGIIGKNGAGKSTLLKLVSKITFPSTGDIKYKGRISSLLEVGTGFHPELTGRENIYFNGSLLGMKYIEIKRKINEIIKFSEIGKFIDTPVKHFSSGMQMRLAFSVAAFLDSDILLIDEVLAVGDASFQKKCIAKMNEISGEKGKTILFVSHNIEAIQNLCDKTIYLKDGKVVYMGDTKEAISLYYKEGNQDLNFNPNVIKSNKKDLLFIDDISLYSDDKNKKILNFSKMKILINFNACSVINNLNIAIGFNNYFGARIAHLNTSSLSQTIRLKKGKEKVEILLDHIPFMSGVYYLDIYCESMGEELLKANNIIGFEVYNNDDFEPYQTKNKGHFLLDYRLLE